MNKTHEKWIVSVIGFDSIIGGETVKFYGGSDTMVVPTKNYYSESPDRAHLFNTHREAVKFAERFRGDTTVQKVTVTVDTTGVDTKVPIGVRVGSVITVKDKEYKITQIGHGRIELKSLSEDKK